MTPSTTTAATARSSAKPQSMRAALPALIGLCLTMLVEMVDNSILNIALPTIGRDLSASPTDLQWIVGAYSLTFGGLLMVGGTLGDMLGRRRTLLVGLALFGASGLAVLLVSNPAQLIAVRAVSGAFAALIAPLTMSLIFRLFDRDDLRTKAIGLIMVVSMIGFAVGPTLAGLAIASWPWQALLVLNAPIAAIAWLGVRFGVDRDDPADRRPGGADIPGALLSVAALGLLLYSFTSGVDNGWTSPITLGVTAGGIAALVGFVWRERTAMHPMLDLKLLALPTVRGSAILQTGVMMAMVGVMFVSTQLYQFAWGWSAFQAGLANLPFVAGMLLAGPFVDRAVAKYGHRRTATGGTALVLISLLVWIYAVGHGFIWCAIAMLIMTAGMRTIMTTGAVALLGALPETHTSIGSAMNDTAQELGNAVGVAIVGTVMAAVVGSSLPQGAWDAATVAGFVHSQQISFAILAVIVVVLGAIGLRSFTDSTETEEH
ncbi:MFS transporter [Brevibacterium sp. BRM-1]|uniref:MFS transporter n=1 Tax=Brevibacterium sp. BRM-1 TaxID=2999062 RepID=UPI00227F349B|nr:MFS transporter [Brevibacterium sp. BRM-1]WAL39108.1 MFS transporter [Brevibacterium sp. BRM-1]